MTNQLVRTLMTLDDQLDDIKRARIWSALEDKLESDVAPTARRRWPYAVAAVAAVAASALLLLRREDDGRTLAVPADTQVTAQLGPYTHAALVGPAQLDFVGAPAAATVVRMRRGTLLAEFDGGAGRSLRIETRGAIVEIVGTLFSVRVEEAVTCTSVAHGRVRVTTPSAVVYVAAGERFCTNEPAVRAIDPTVRESLDAHRKVITASAPATAHAPAPVVTPIEAPDVVAPVVAPVDVAAPVVAAPVVAAPVDVAAPVAPVTSKPAVTSKPTVTSKPHVRAISKPDRASTSAPVPEPEPEPVPVPETAPAPAISPPSAPAIPQPLPPTPVKPTVATIEKPAAPPVTADDLYRGAESALASRDAKTADRLLASLLAQFPSSPLVDQALYDRARIAYQQRSWKTARQHLDQLATVANTRLAEPGHYLRCRIAVESKDAAASACFLDYRKRFPRSPHDLDALAVLAQHAHVRGGCDAARAFVDEILAAYPRTTIAATWRERCEVKR